MIRYDHLRQGIIIIGFVLGSSLTLGGCARDPQKLKQNYLQSGMRFLEKGKYDEAVIQFQNALKVDPRFVDAVYQMGKAHMANRDLQGAYNALRQAIALDPSRLDAHLALAQVYINGRQYADAEKEASLVVGKDPSNASAHQLLGVSLAQQMETNRAIEAFAKAAELQPKNASFHMDLGVAEMSAKRYSDAEIHLRKAIELKPTFAAAYSNLATFYRLQRQLPAAVQILKQGLDNIPDDPNLYLTLADFFYRQQQKGTADATLDRLRDHQPKALRIALQIGDFYFARGETDKALAHYSRGVVLDQKNTEVRNHMVECYLSAGRLNEAQTLNNQTLQQRPKDIFAGILKGRILLAQGSSNEGLIELQKLVTHAQDSGEAHYFLAMAYWRNRNLEQAKTELLQALMAKPGLTPAKQSLVELHLALREISAARELAEELVKANPFDAGKQVLLANVCLRQSEPVKAKEHFLAARALAHGEAAIATGLAQVFVQERKWIEAERELERLLSEQPRFSPALQQLVSVLVAQNQRKKAITRVQLYISEFPNDASAHILLGKLSKQDKQILTAKAAFSRAIQLDPKLPEAYAQLAGVFQDEGDVVSAIREFEKALEIDSVPYLHTLVGDLYRQQKDREMARKHYQRALAIDPNFVFALNNLAAMYAAEGSNLDIAMGLAQKAKQLQPDSTIPTGNLAWIQYKKGLYDSAIPLLQECVAKAPESPEYHYHLGMALLANGEKQKSKNHLASALRLKLNQDDARDARQAMKRLE